MTWQEQALVGVAIALGGWLLLGGLVAFAVGFRRGWREYAERKALDGDTVVGDRTDRELWAMIDQHRRRTGR